ncbi:MAG: hypothetical protein IT425_10545 [Pirellulales bacterium]|nr:hypothetical protein [Pirellulales bacterium]
MRLFLEDAWTYLLQSPTRTWDWFNSLNREEWLVVLIVICAAGFVSLFGLQTRRL